MNVRTCRFFAGIAFFTAAVAVYAGRGDVVVGNVRVQFLSPTLVRLEQKGPKGFENRPTFTVVQRRWAGVEWKNGVVDNDRYADYITRTYTVRVLDGGKSLAGTQVVAPSGAILYEFKGTPPGDSDFPAPGKAFGAWTMADNPRIVPPKWGATPGPDPNDPTSGWDLGNDAPDVYVFVNAGKGYPALRREFLRLTGPVAMPPLYMLGFIDSRYHPYTEEEALAVIDQYRGKRIPLDVFVVDTDWRVGASHGYATNAKLFPDMQRFIDEAHKRNVRLMYNDHPEPVAPTATDPKELQYRWDGLTSLLKMGVDVWWYDRNWGTHIATPAQGLPLEVWGMRVYTDMTQRLRPNQRPVIMSNVWGIDNGYRNRPTHPAAHRYPVWWTGDTQAQWQFLQMGVKNGVDAGVLSLLPYVNEDLGGHVGEPSPELYVRFLQFGCLSPVTRVHCTRGNQRYPWGYGPEAEKIVTEYVRLRYRLLPTLYTAARRAYDDGTPLLRRCDLMWPTVKAAADSTQYMLGDDILVAPILDSVDATATPVPQDELSYDDGHRGLRAEYFNNPDLEGEPALVRIDKNVAFDWGRGKPADRVNATNFSVRWTGRIGPMSETGAYKFSTRTDDGVRVWIDGRLVIDSWVPQAGGIRAGKVDLERGKSYDLKVEYCQFGGEALCFLRMQKPSDAKREAGRAVWIPPGQWRDLWTGAVLVGPKTVRVESPLWHTPMFARVGGMVILAPEVQFTTQARWDKPILEAFVPAGDGSTTRELYEDDGLSLGYQRSDGPTMRIPITMARQGRQVRFVLGPGRFTGAMGGGFKPKQWTLRLHLPGGEKVKTVTVDGKPLKSWRTMPLGPTSSGMGVMPFSTKARVSSRDGQIVEIPVSSDPLAKRTVVVTCSK